MVKYAASISNDVNDYLRAVTGADVTAKDFRTWSGTVLAAQALSTLGSFTSQREAKTKVRAAVHRVAESLGNTVSVAASATSIRPSSRAIQTRTLPAIPACAGGDADMKRAEKIVLRYLRGVRAAAAGTPQRA